ncbi:MAG TPA: methylmalonyl-CoA epimerase [Nitrolancea sp.]|nr:methylmalonyl-CoA epimerase [Nitrolancea sp.]
MALQQLMPADRGLHHVGIVVRDLQQAIERYRRLGFGEPIEIDLPDQFVRVATFSAGAGYLELITPTVPDTGVSRFLDARGEGMHHMAFTVRDLEQSLRQLEDAGVELIDLHPRTGAHGWRVAFIHPRSCGGVLTELVEG